MSLFDASFFKRLGFYLVGLSLGLVFLAFFFKEKRTEFCYLPNCRVLKSIRSKPLVYDDLISDRLVTQKIDSTALDLFFRESEVIFSKSDTNKKPCKLYVIEGAIDSKTILMKVENCPDKSVVIEIK